MRRYEIGFLVVVILLLGGAVFADRKFPVTDRAQAPTQSGKFLSTGWYCPSPDFEGVDASMSTANLGDEPVHLRRWAIGDTQTSPLSQAALASHRRSAVKVRDFGIPQATGLSEAFGAATTSDIVALGSAGVASSRCSNQPWDKWYFAQGSTARGLNTYLLVSNPFEEEAVLRVRFLTPGGDTTPARLKDLVVPRLSQSAVFLSEYLTETPTFGIDLTATQGRVIVSRFMQATGKDGSKGISLGVGVRNPASKWLFAGGHVPTDGEETIQLANPTETEALIQVVFETEQEQRSPPALQEVRLPAGRQTSIKVSDFLERGTKHSTTISVTNETKIVAERTTVEALNPGRGIDTVFGVPDFGGRWVVAVGSPAGGTDTIDILNAGTKRTTVSIAFVTEGGLSRPPALQAIKIEGGRRASLDVSSSLAGAAATAIIESTEGSIAVERHLVLGPPYSDFADSVAQIFD